MRGPVDRLRGIGKDFDVGRTPNPDSTRQKAIAAGIPASTLRARKRGAVPMLAKRITAVDARLSALIADIDAAREVGPVVGGARLTTVSFLLSVARYYLLKALEVK